MIGRGDAIRGRAFDRRRRWPLARAKRTERADARRRYRAQLASQLETEDGDEGAADQPQAQAQSAKAPPPRPGIRSAFSQAFRPIDLRGDLRYLPTLVRQRSVIVPVVITFVSTVVAIVAIAPRTGGQPSLVDIVVVYIFNIFTAPPPVGASFLAGFLAVRASWLAGILTSLVSSVCWVAVITLQPAGGAATTATGGATLVTNVNPAAYLAEVIFFAVPPAALFAAMAAWYRRFLQLASPARREAAARQQREAARRARNPRLARGR
jgi:hypothetical protein